MNRLVYLLILAQQTGLVLASYWPLTLVLVAVWASAFVATPTKTAGERWCLLMLGCMPLFLIPMAILLCGVVFVHDPSTDADVDALAYPLHLIWGLLLSLLPLTAAMIWHRPARWPAVVATAMLVGHMSWSAVLISAMSVSGVWL